MKREIPNPYGKAAESKKRQPARSYQAPELQGYGSLKELTQTLSTQTPGDGFGASFAT